MGDCKQKNSSNFVRRRMRKSGGVTSERAQYSRDQFGHGPAGGAAEIFGARGTETNHDADQHSAATPRSLNPPGDTAMPSPRQHWPGLHQPRQQPFNVYQPLRHHITSDVRFAATNIPLDSAHAPHDDVYWERTNPHGYGARNRHSNSGGRDHRATFGWIPTAPMTHAPTLMALMLGSPAVFAVSPADIKSAWMTVALT